jgi:hypothetical protein
VNNRRYDTATQTYVLIGNYQFDIIAQISPVCSPSPITPSFVAHQTGSDTATDSCSVNYLVLRSNQALNSSSVDTNGSNFNVFSVAQQTPISIAKVVPLGDKLLRLEYAAPLTKNDTLLITTQLSSDSSSIRNACHVANIQTDSIYHIIKGCSGIGLSEVTQGFSLYPNPSHNWVIIAAAGENTISHIAIYNIQGQKVLFQENYNNEKISTASFSPGIYLVKAYGKGTNLGSAELIIKP